jgi:nucleoside-diphosphate-sugar epimerase
MKVLITGVSGFIGSKVASNLDCELVGLSRRADYAPGFPIYSMSIGPSEDFTECLQGVSVIVHCAARVHIMSDSVSDPLDSYRAVNTEGTLNLARQAAQAGVKRFIFISTIKVNGESTKEGQAFTANDTPCPEDPYGVSKSEAEASLLDLAKKTGLEVVIIRPPLVYGEGVKGNFKNLVKLARLPLPLPFGAIYNRRSMVYVQNLVDLIIVCIEHENAPNRIWLVSDDDDLSLSRLISLVRKALGKPECLLPVPVGVFRLIGKLTRKEQVVDRLIGNLRVDCSKTKEALGWTPSYTVEQGIKAAVAGYC